VTDYQSQHLPVSLSTCLTAYLPVGTKLVSVMNCIEGTYLSQFWFYLLNPACVSTFSVVSGV